MLTANRWRGSDRQGFIASPGRHQRRQWSCTFWHLRLSRLYL